MSVRDIAFDVKQACLAVGVLRRDERLTSAAERFLKDAERSLDDARYALEDAAAHMADPADGAA